MLRFTLLCHGLRCSGLALVSLALVFDTRALETDNFYLPPDEEFADLGDFLEVLHTRAIEAGVEKVNSSIERALQLKEPAARQTALEKCHSAEAVVAAVAGQFGDSIFEKSRIERALANGWARSTYPGQIVEHSGLSMNLWGRMPIDPRVLVMFFQCCTIKADGVYLGTDKLTHFHHQGLQFYHRYRGLLNKGFSPEEARTKVIRHFANNAVFAEDKLFGTILTGVYSNADMAANYLGFKFFLNLTEPVMLEGLEHEALVVRCGVFWRLNDHVRPHSGWFASFISDHLNEALNPNLYDATMRPHIRKILEHRAGRIVEFYTQRDGRPADPAYFNRLAQELSTYYGEPYGHSGKTERLMTIGNTCIPALQSEDRAAASQQASSSEPGGSR